MANSDAVHRSQTKEYKDMAHAINVKVSAPIAGESDSHVTLTGRLLACGTVAGSLFIVVALVQAFVRPGFDIRRHAISMLTLGDLGWIQIADFVLGGVLFTAFAIGVKQVLHPGRAGTWGPVLFAGFGLGLVLAGIFHPDPGLGFPPGAPQTMPTKMSSHAILHSLAFFLAFSSITAACFVLERRFAALGQTGWMVASIVVGVAAPLLVVLGMTSLIATGVAFAMATAATTWWLAAVAAKLLAETRRTSDNSDTARLTLS
jgi:uncharacterized protein DUF998